MKSPAIFLDRDGTLIENVGYIRRPEDVRLMPGTGEALHRLRQMGYRLVLVSNQSGVARGLFSDEQLQEVHRRFEQLLAAEGVRLDGAYYCPYLPGPEAVVESYRRDSELRKPRPGMLLKAAQELNIDLGGSWMIGDSPSDMEAGRRAGCRTVLLGANGHPGDKPLTPPSGVDPSTPVVPHLRAAADCIARRMAETCDSAPAPPRPATLAPVASADEKRKFQESHEMLQTLMQIRDRLDDARRQSQQTDFSIYRLLGALLQMFAIVTAVWGFLALVDADSTAATRFALATFCQVAALTAFTLDRLR